ncbi:MAG TPA: 5'/3'-nucleotidase SurE [Clostridia bacterium]|nr:5'/3'-nucleotidase SurE [Clostridia bacterium]
MYILITNDDGIYAPGITALRRCLEPIAKRVTVAAPDRERSASGHGITVHRPLRATEVFYKKETTKGWMVDGTPADCVKLALDALLDEEPDLVISGINFGPNLGTDVLYSGTVSASLEALINGVPSLAVSLATSKMPDFEIAGDFVQKIVPIIVKEVLPEKTLLNINVPSGNPRGVRVSRLCNRRYVNVFHKRTDPRGKDYFWTAGEPLNLDQDDPETDARAINEGYISVTPVHFDLTDYGLLEKLRDWPFPLQNHGELDI